MKVMVIVKATKDSEAGVMPADLARATVSELRPFREVRTLRP